VDGVGGGGEHAEHDEIAVVVQDVARDEAGGDVGALFKVGEQAGEFEHFGVREAAGGVGLDDPADIGDAVEDHLRLLAGVAAKRAVGEHVENDGVVGLFLHRLGVWFHDRAERYFGVGENTAHLTCSSARARCVGRRAAAARVRRWRRCMGSSFEFLAQAARRQATGKQMSSSG